MRSRSPVSVRPGHQRRPLKATVTGHRGAAAGAQEGGGSRGAPCAAPASGALPRHSWPPLLSHDIGTVSRLIAENSFSFNLSIRLYLSDGVIELRSVSDFEIETP